MKILLISLPAVTFGQKGGFTYLEAMALLYLGSALRAEGHEVSAWDSIILGGIPGIPGWVTNIEIQEITMQGANPEFLRFRIEVFCPDIIGISIPNTSDYPLGLLYTEAIKTNYPNIILILGGPHVTQNPQECMDSGFADYIVTGEGEVVLPALVNEIEAGNLDPDISGVWHKDKSPDFALIQDIDKIIPPAWDLLPGNGEFMHWCNKEGRKISIFSSRGCPYDCSFCSSSLLNRRKWRAHSVERVLWEIDTLVNKYHIQGTLFRDDNPTVDIHRFHNIMEGIIKARHGIGLEAMNFRADLLPKETLKAMKSAGFYHINLFPESGSQRVLDELMNKKLDLANFHKAVDDILDVGMDIGVCLMVGMPGETKEDIEKTLNFAYKLKDKGVARFQVSIATPMKGTKMYSDCIKAGYFAAGDSDDFSYGLGNFDTEHWTGAEMTLLRKHMMKELN